MKNQILQNTINWILIFKLPIIILVFFIFVFMGYLGQFIEYDSSANIDNILKENDPVLLEYNQFEEDFGSNKNIIVVLETDNIYTTPFMTILIELVVELERIDGINEVVTLSTLNDITGTSEELFVEEDSESADQSHQHKE